MQKETKAPVLLLVEDSEDDAYFFKHTLQRSRITCILHHVLDGAEAVEFLQNALSGGGQDLPRSIFLDLKMPVLNGFEVLEWMKTQSFPSSMQIIVLSGSDHESDRMRAAQLGAIDYLVKPVKVADLHRFLWDICPPELGARA